MLARAHGGVGDSDPYVVPAGFIWIIRDVELYNGNLLDGVTASVTTTDEITVVSASWLGATGCYQWTGRVVLDQEDDFFQLHANFAVDFYVSGYELVAP